MKRDVDLIRRIVLAVRAAEPGKHISCFEDVDRIVFLEHVQLLLEANLVEGRVLPGYMGEPADAVISRLTWSGQDFADSINDDTIWNKAKNTILKPTVSWTFSLLSEWLKTEARKHLPGVI
uniref:DUF2513 domain-containing protein n=1 Tax=Sulfuriferula sp. GW6 TaxID=3345112 RepID=UPI0039F6C0F9